MKPVSKLGTLIHSEIVSVYVGLNIALVNLSVLGVSWLTDARIKSIIAIGDVLFGAVVRALVTPTTLSPVVPAEPPHEGTDIPADTFGLVGAVGGSWSPPPTPPVAVESGGVPSRAANP